MMVDWAGFTPWHALIGGALIGLAAALLWLGLGRIAGVSGIAGRLLHPATHGSERSWRALFLAGLIGGALLAHLAVPDPIAPRSGFGLWMLLGGGLLVGFGTRMGSGCTSGHGVCGISRLSPRGTSATIVFMVSAMLTVYLIRHVVGIGVGP